MKKKQRKLLGKVTEQELMKDTPQPQKEYNFTRLEALIINEHYGTWGRAYLFKDGDSVVINTNGQVLKEAI